MPDLKCCNKKISISSFVILLLVSNLFSQPLKKGYYQEPTWKPRVILPYDDAIHDDFWPKSPKVETNYEDNAFEQTRLSEVPAPGTYPRVMITLKDVELIRNKINAGENAPKSFQALWNRFKNNPSAFNALVTQNDSLGKSLAAQLVLKAKALDKKMPIIDAAPDRDNIWSVDRSIVASGDPDPATEIYELIDFDYLTPWLNSSEKEYVLDVIAKICYKRISNFLVVPDHFMINNHEGFGMEYIRLLLLLEGRRDFDKALFDLALKKANAMLDWYLDKDGMCFESIKGWLNISAFLALGHRQPNLLKHSHLRAKMKFFHSALRWESGEWHIRDEMRASAFHVIWMMHYFHPKDEGIDFLYQSSFSTHDFLRDPKAKWQNPVGISDELLLLFADNGIIAKDGKNIDWTLQSNIDRLNLSPTWQDSMRGYVDVRNSWKKEDLHLGFVCKQDFFYGGHEGSENNRLTLWKDGVNWIQDNHMLATKATFLQNMLTVDGKGCHWPPAPGTWLGVKESKDFVTACGDGKDGFGFYKSMQIHPFSYPSSKVPYYRGFTEGNFDLERNIQVAYHPGTIRYNDGYAHTDYGAWSGETRLVEGYRPWNTMEKAYRTVHVAKGNYPYVLVLDDAKKDDKSHLFEWNISVPIDAELFDVTTPEIVFQNTEPSPIRISDIILHNGALQRNKDGKGEVKKGTPLCLIRVLQRNTNYGFPVASLEKFQKYSLVKIPAISSNPDFKILIYPFRFGDPLPETQWITENETLKVEFAGQKDFYTFAKTDGERTVYKVIRNKDVSFSSNAAPARPNLIVRGKTFNQNSLRYTVMANDVPEYLTGDSVAVGFEAVQPPFEIHYTLDGTTPTLSSPQYTKPFYLSSNLNLKAVVINSNWDIGNKSSDVLTVKFIHQNLSVGKLEVPGKEGVFTRIYEASTKLYNDKGFFQANRIMMPDLDKMTPTVTTKTEGFRIPWIAAKAAFEEQTKGFYRFTAWFLAEERGVYEFDVYSCGPVVLKAGNQIAIEATGIFHQEQNHRYGSVGLTKGWHQIDLTVCDPLYWFASSLDTMPFSISYRHEGGAFLPLSNLRTTEEIPFYKEDIKKLQSIRTIPLMEKGFLMKQYDRTGKRMENDFLDIDEVQPYNTKKVMELEATSNKNGVRAFDGYYYAAQSGVYSFKLPYRNGEGGSLGALRATCQNQLVIDKAVIAQKGVGGRLLSGRVYLEEGWHEFSYRFGPSLPNLSVTLPDNQSIALNGRNIFRAASVEFEINDKPISDNLIDLSEPVSCSLKFPADAESALHYTLDGSTPTLSSPVYKSAFVVNKSVVVTAVPFKNNQALSTPTTKTLNFSNELTASSMGYLDFRRWDEQYTGSLKKTCRFKWWLPETSKIAYQDGVKVLEMTPQATTVNKIVDVNVSRGKILAGLKIYDMNMRDNVLSIAIWFKTNNNNGKIFGKDGYNAYGKGYKTVSMEIVNGTLSANPNKLKGGQVKNDEWQFATLIASEKAIQLYLNGKLVSSALGSKEISTDALDFFANHNAMLGSLQLFDRELSEGEVEKLFAKGFAKK